jgi:hypothetical protein
MLVGLRYGRIPLWVPVFLLWPLALALFLLAFPFLFIYTLFRLGLRAFRFWFLGLPRAYAFLCALRGLRISVQAPGRRFAISLV